MALSQYRCDEALALFDALPAEQRNTGWVLHHIGCAHFHKSNYPEAQRAFVQMRSVAPERMAGLEIYSTVLWHLDDHLSLSHLAQECAAFNRRAPEVWCVVGNCFSQQKEHELALKFFQRSIQVCRVCVNCN
jgi:anaphase-promoting complex subunit 3